MAVTIFMICVDWQLGAIESSESCIFCDTRLPRRFARIHDRYTVIVQKKNTPKWREIRRDATAQRLRATLIRQYKALNGAVVGFY